MRRAPVWWQQHGLEWLYRLGSEPRRLFKRYMVTNALFVVGFLRQVLGDKIRFI
jgi:N-acetylglucosaminyldiphosphoundecaprenol N-acetyl-beta-D-mannosaminyltransferase